MVKIRDVYPKNASGGYERVFNNHEVGELMTRVQSTVIRNGVELENIIVDRVSDKGHCIDDLDAFIKSISRSCDEDNSYLCSKKIVCKSKFKQKNQPDFLIFDKKDGKIRCWVIELKDGDMFDTKKALGEKEHLQEFTKKFSKQLKRIPNCEVSYGVCCFNQNDKQYIKNGFKDIFDEDHIFTGRDLCKMLGLDYDAIVSARKKDAEDNLDYFVEQLLGIDSVQDVIGR
ncbi:MAG: restriction endonuclease [Candidatus Saccharibacteria bacterium]|nr:restriction endonuclease [Candidatus Saccharibacteria bacterium]